MMTNAHCDLPTLLPTPVTPTSVFADKERLIWHRRYPFEGSWVGPDQGCWTSYEYLAACSAPIEISDTSSRWLVEVVQEADSYRGGGSTVLVPIADLWHIVTTYGDSYSPMRDGGPIPDLDLAIDDAGSKSRFPVFDPAAPPARRLTAAIACRGGLAGRRAWVVNSAGDLKPGYRVVSEPHPHIEVPDPTQPNPNVGAGSAHLTVVTDRAWFGAHQSGQPVDPNSVASVPYHRVFID